MRKYKLYSDDWRKYQEGRREGEINCACSFVRSFILWRNNYKRGSRSSLLRVRRAVRSSTCANMQVHVHTYNSSGQCPFLSQKAKKLTCKVRIHKMYTCYITLWYATLVHVYNISLIYKPVSLEYVGEWERLLSIIISSIVPGHRGAYNIYWEEYSTCTIYQFIYSLLYLSHG